MRKIKHHKRLKPNLKFRLSYFFIGFSVLVFMAMALLILRTDFAKTAQALIERTRAQKDSFYKLMYTKSLNEIKNIINPSQSSENAYVTLISGIDRTYKYRGFLFNALIMKKALSDSGSTADFVALIGFNDPDESPYEADLSLLRTNGIITYILPRLLNSSKPLSFAEMALLKITPWSFVQYKRIQFFDGDIMPTKNMDCYFNLEFNTFTNGIASPLNSGWYVAIPNSTAYQSMLSKAIWRLNKDWNPNKGWGEKLPTGLYFRGGKIVKQWDFNGADMDQGLLTHYFVITHGNVILLDTELRSIRIFQNGFKNHSPKLSTFKDTLKCCHGKDPTSFFVHFTGQKKPWMMETEVFFSGKSTSSFRKWANYLDSLHLYVNSSTISGLRLGSPLGFYNKDLKLEKSSIEKSNIEKTSVVKRRRRKGIK